MKKLFIAFIIIVVAGAAAVFGFGFIKKADYIAKSHSSVEVNKTWKVALSHYVNETGLTLSVDGEVLDENRTGDSYMNEDMELMLERNTVSDAFNCSVNLYDDQSLRILKGSTDIEVDVNNASEMKVNGKSVPIEHSPVKTEDQVFIPSELLTEGIGYSYDWDTNTKTVSMASADPSAPFLPSYFNYAEIGKLSSARDQGSLGACWAFAALSAVESTLMPEQDLDFSEDHMLHHNGFGLNLEDGGDHIMAMAYLSSWKGPVFEEDDPYGDDETDDSLLPVKHVQEVQITEEKDYEKIKEMVYKYGAVESSIHIALLDPNTIDPEYYDYYNYSYCYKGDEIPNHEIIIIGWDDHYPASNFIQPVSQDGAFICRNSWGSDFGDNGIFYISYEDSVIGSGGEVYTRIENPDNYDHIYQYDECGWIGRVGYNKNHAFFANIYTAERNESLMAVSFYATGPDTSYKVYVQTDPGAEGEAVITVPQTALAEGHLNNTGYYTIDLKEPVPLNAGQDYAVIVEIDTAESSHPIAMEINADDMRTKPVVLEGKRSYISSYGDLWENTQESSKCNVCLKAFTNDR